MLQGALDSLRESVDRGKPYGSERWVASLKNRAGKSVAHKPDGAEMVTCSRCREQITGRHEKYCHRCGYNVVNVKNGMTAGGWWRALAASRYWSRKRAWKILPRYTDRLRAVMLIANHIALDLDAEMITPDHCFAALVYEGSGVGMTLLEVCGVMKADVRHPYSSTVQPPNDEGPRKPRLRLDQSTKQVVDAASEAAFGLGDHHVGTEHFVLALADLPRSPFQNKMLKSQAGVNDLRAALSMIRLWAAGDEALGSRRWKEAVDHYRAAIAIKPTPVVLNNLAWILATCPANTIRSGQEALSLIKSAVTDPSDAPWWMLGTLAAALAEVGNFNEARAWGIRAMELAGGADNGKWAKRVADFEQSQPVREM